MPPKRNQNETLENSSKKLKFNMWQKNDIPPTPPSTPTSSTTKYDFNIWKSKNETVEEPISIRELTVGVCMNRPLRFRVSFKSTKRETKNGDMFVFHAMESDCEIQITVFPQQTAKFFDVIERFLLLLVVDSFLTIFHNYISLLMDKYFRLYEKVSRKSVEEKNVNETNGGNDANILRKKDYETYQAIKYGSGIKSASMTGSTVMLIDLDLIKLVNQKDFANFPDRHPPSYHSDPAMNKMLSFATGDEWKRLKSILTQAFSASRIRRVNEGLHKTAMKLCDFMRFQLNDPAAEGSQQLEIVSPINKYLLELIACSVFGLENTGIFVSNDSPFEIYTKQVQRAMIRHRQARQYPGLVQLAKLFNLFRPSAEALRFFEETIHLSIDKRLERGETGDDLLQLLMEATSPNSKHNNGKLTTDMILSQALMFFFAGTEGPATLLVYGLYELAKNPDVQQRLYDEIAPIMEMDNCIDDVTLTKLEYLDMFVCEVLRMYSSSVIARRCQSKYQLPGTDIVIEPGTNVHTPIYGIHHDEEYYPNPFSFNPDNFTEEAKRKRPAGAYLTFGVGPRACIAQKFGLIQGKSAICHLVYNFHVKTCSRTESPPKGSIESMYLPINGLWLTLDDRKNKI